MLDGGSFQADISPEIIDGTPLIRSYGDDFLQIGIERYQQGMAIYLDQITSPWGPETIHNLSLDHLQSILDQTPEIIIIGTGRLTAFPNEDILNKLHELHIGFECMDSRAACRTYNILVAEGRKVAAFLLLPNAHT